MLIDLNGKVAIVTGAGRGIGREIAFTLAREGVTTVILDVDATNLAEIRQQFEEQELQGNQYVCDVREYAQITQVISDVAGKYGRIDILVNNAGVANGGTVEALQEHIWDLNLDTNLKGTFLMCKAVAPFMKKQRKGRIINAASFAAIVPSYGSAAYASSLV